MLRTGSLVSFHQHPYFFQDVVSHFGKLLLDFLTVWSGIEAVVVVIHITVSFVRLGTGRGFHRRVCKCRYEISEQNCVQEVFHHAMIVEKLVIKKAAKAQENECFTSLTKLFI